MSSSHARKRQDSDHEQLKQREETSSDQLRDEAVLLHGDLPPVESQVDEFAGGAVLIHGEERPVANEAARAQQDRELERQRLAAALQARVMEERRLFSRYASRMMEGLATRAQFVDEARAQRMKQVYDAFRPYVEGKDLPPGTTPQIMRFLVVSAGVPGLWQRLDETDPRLAEALLGCYAEGLGMEKLAERLPGVNNAAMASYLVRRGLKKLFKWLPEQSENFPIDKSVAFPLDQLMTARQERLRAAGQRRGKVNRSSEWGRRTVARRWYPEGTRVEDVVNE